MWRAFDYESSDFNSMLLLMKDNYGDVEIANKNFIEWEYFKNPSGDAIIKVARNENNDVVGQYILSVMDFKIFEKMVKATLSLNTLTNKNYLRLGIFTMLSEMAFKTCENESIAFTYGFPNQNSYPGFVNKMNFTDLHKVPLLIYPCNARSLVQKKVNRLLAFCMPNFFFSLNKKFDSSKVIEMSKDNLYLVDKFWDDVKDKYPIMAKRNQHFLKWRYFDVPIREYIVFGYIEDNELLGYIVAATKEIDGIQNGMIVDFLTKDNDMKIGKALVLSCYAFFKERKTELLGCLMLEHTTEYRVLRKCGFIRCPKIIEPQPFPLIYRAHQTEYDIDEMKNIGNWFITMGDYDVV